jgi:AraC-like DNA-binding protein
MRELGEPMERPDLPPALISAEVPAFGRALFSAGTVDMHATRVSLPHGGSGVFNHTEPQVSLLVSGRSWLSVGDFSGWLEPGALYVLPAGPRRIAVAPGTVAYSIGLGTEKIRGRSAVDPTFATLGGRRLREWQDRVQALCDEPHASRSELSAAIAPFVANAAESRAGGRYDVVRSFFEVAETSLDRAFSLHELSEHFGYAPNHLNDIIRLRTGRSIRQWQIALRLNAARDALSQTSSPIGEIARSFGFDPAFFARTFYRHYELTPRQWRVAAMGPTNLWSMAARLNADGIVHIDARLP